MSRYILFQYDHYYPSGGMDDAFGIFDTIEAAKSELRPEYDIASIFDIQELKTVSNWGDRDCVWVECDEAAW